MIPLRGVGILTMLLVPGGLVQAGAPVEGADLADAATAFGEAVLHGDAAAMSPHLASSGVRLHLVGRGHEGVAPRQVAAAIREFGKGFRSLSVELHHVAELGGTPLRGSAELEWLATVAGTGDVLRFTIFLGFVHHGDRWAISEVRVLPSG